MFKIDGISSGRGIALFDVHSSKAMKIIRSKIGKEPEELLYQAI